jgi:hypothetical protein
MEKIFIFQNNPLVMIEEDVYKTVETVAGCSFSCSPH